MGRLIDAMMMRLGRIMAYVGGAVLMILTIITAVSIIGRSLITIAYNGFIQENLGWLSKMIVALGAGPVQGDFELLEAGVAFAIFAFLPWCQITRSHAVVDLFTNTMPAPFNRFVDLIAELLFAAILLLIAWRHWIATGDKMRYGETTFILQFPVWWAWMLSGIAATVAAIIAVWMVTVRAREIAGRRVIDNRLGALH